MMARTILLNSENDSAQHNPVIKMRSTMRLAYKNNSNTTQSGIEIQNLSQSMASLLCESQVDQVTNAPPW